MCALLISECCIDFLRSEIECGVDKPRPLAKPNLIKISNNPDRSIGGLDYFCGKLKNT